MKQDFQIDGIGINKEFYADFKEADFIKDILPGIPDRFGDDKKKTEWAKNAFAIMTGKDKK